MFRIEWNLPEEAWREAAAVRSREEPGSEYDRAGTPLYDLLYGDLQLQADGVELFPAGGFNISLLDFAHGLAYAFDGSSFATGDRAVATFRQADDALELEFERDEGVVRVRSNLDGAPVLEVPAAEFAAEIERFRTTFLAEVERRAPTLLEWHSLELLRP